MVGSASAMLVVSAKSRPPLIECLSIASPSWAELKFELDVVM
jgi:hypothetical protein